MHHTVLPTAGTLAAWETGGAQILIGMGPKTWGMNIWIRLWCSGLLLA